MRWKNGCRREDEEICLIKFTRIDNAKGTVSFLLTSTNFQSVKVEEKKKFVVVVLVVIG